MAAQPQLNLKFSYSFWALLILLFVATVPVSAFPPSDDSNKQNEKQAAQTDTLQSLQTIPQNFSGKPLWHEMVTNVPSDWLKYSKITFRNDKVTPYATVAVMTAILIATDEPTWQNSKRMTQNSPTIKTASNFFTNFGDGTAQLSLSAALAAYGIALNDDRALRTASQSVQALLAGGMVVQVLKHITGRESPFVATSPTGIWRFFPNQIDYHKYVPHYDAFPSGHICTSLSTVIVIAENYPELKWVRPVGYTLVGLIGVSMVNTGIHWYSDYPLGLLIGYTFGMIAAHPDKLGYDIAHFGKDDSHTLTVAPASIPGGIGVAMSLNLY